jgi:hypothetical protein
MAYVRAGARVCVTPKKTAKGKGLSYSSFCGKLAEDAVVGPTAGWDVVDVIDSRGRERSVYSFSLRRGRARR